METRSISRMAQDVRVTNVYRGKNLQIVGIIAIVMGICLIVGDWPANYDESFLGFGTGLALTVGGTILNLVGKAQHWYHAE